MTLTSISDPFAEQTPKLSVCMIVRDEEENLPRSLRSVESIADELVIVDTGSKDNTIAIAKDFGAKVYSFEWCDDFAAARNESLKHATGDWILQLDADEELLPESCDALKEALLKADTAVHVLRCDNGSESMMRYHWFSRLFRHHPLIRYFGRYHESIDRGVQDLMKVDSKWEMELQPHIIIRHYGYTPDQVEQKSEKAISLIESHLKEHPDDGYMLSRLGIAYFNVKRFEEAESYFRKGLEKTPADATASFLLASTLVSQKRPEEAVPYYQQAIAIDPYLFDAYARIAEIFIGKGLINEGIQELKKGLRIDGEQPLLQSRLEKAEEILAQGIDDLKSALDSEPESAAAHNDLGFSYISQGLYDDAVEALKKAIDLDPDLANAHLNLGLVYVKKGLMDDGLHAFEKALDIDPDYGKAHFNIAVVYQAKGDFKNAISHCDKAVELGVSVHPQLLAMLKPYR